MLAPVSALPLALLLGTAPALGPWEAETLDGRPLRIPDRLEGSAQVLLVAFERDRADALERAHGRLSPLERELPGLAIYQTPVIGKVNAFLQAVILGSQRLSLPRARHARYAPLFVDRKDAMAALGVVDPGACVAVVLVGARRVVVTGACEPDLLGRVRAALETVRNGAPAPATAAPPAAPLPAAP